MLRFIVKFSVNARARERIFEGMKARARKNMLKDASSRRAPEAPAKQNVKNFFFSPILVSGELII